MKFIKEQYDDSKGEWVRDEITEAEARAILECYYNNVDEIIKTPCYYRVLWDRAAPKGVNVAATVASPLNSRKNSEV